MRVFCFFSFLRNDREIKFSIPANAGISAGDSDLHRNGKAAEFREKNAVIPAKAGIYSGRLILEFREFYGKIKFGIFARFFCKKRGECGGLSAKMDSRVRGNDGGNPHILREKLILEFPQNDRKKVHSIPANAAEFREKTPSFPRKRESIRGD